MSDVTILHFAEIDSTNAYFKRTWASQPSFAFAFASHQSAGKGRGLRQWSDVPGKNLLFSLLIKDKDIVKEGGFLSLVASSAVCALLEEEGIEDPKIKWPNDVYVGEKKICGILLQGQLPDYVILGIGLNVNQTSFEGEYRVPPTSMALENGKTWDLGDLEGKIVAKLASFLNHGPLEHAPFLRYFETRDYLKNKTIVREGTTYVVQGIDGDFALVCLDEKGNRIRLVSGEID